MLVLAALGSSGGPLVDAERLDAALRYLDPGDREAANALLHGRPQGHARLETALGPALEAEARQEAEAEFQASAREENPRRAAETDLDRRG